MGKGRKKKDTNYDQESKKKCGFRGKERGSSNEEDLQWSHQGSDDHFYSNIIGKRGRGDV